MQCYFQQLLGSNELRKLPLQQLRRQDDRPFRLDKFVRSEDAVRVATSLFALVAQDFRIDRDRWLLSYHLFTFQLFVYFLSFVYRWRVLSKDNSDSINAALLRQQQLRLAVVRAVRVFFGHQNTLRRILRQTVAVGAATSMEAVGEDFGEASIAKDPERREVLLIQRLLAKATHPSPVKAVFAAEELESAALAVSQYLASAVAAKKTGGGGGPSVADPVSAADVDNDEARPTDRHLQPPTPAAAAAPQQAGAAVTSRDLRRSRRSRPKVRPPSPPPASATVRQLVEMGFPRHAVEYAVKELGCGIGDMGPSPESVVGWLLEHPDQTDLLLEGQTPAAADQEDDDSDSFSDSFEDIDASGASDGIVLGNAQNEPSGGVGRVFQRRCDLSSNDEYAIYVREHISVGMSVRCCRSYEEVHEGDVGRVVKLDRDNLHDLNVQVDWQRKGGTYWVRYIHVELLPGTSGAGSAAGPEVHFTLDQVSEKNGYATLSIR